jgi:deferrochelatase/peroxidase EfeB
MVYRKLHENVGTFNRFLEEQSKSFPGSKEMLAAKFAGRWRDNGAPIVHAPDDAGKAEWDKKFAEADFAGKKRMLTDFTYNEDIHGVKCPYSAHLRRINPRGSLEFGVKDAYETPGALVNRRRILRRGLPYGEVKDPNRDDGNHGIIFMALNADIQRQFEFIQQQWINYANDFKEGNDKEVLLGNHDAKNPSKIVMSAEPGSGKPPHFVSNIPRLVETRGGDYFFIPSITALKAIAAGIVDPT